MKNLSVIIVNFNGARETMACLKSLQETISTEVTLSVVVIDNGSKNKELNKAMEELRKNKSFNNIEKITTVISEEKNLGFSGGNNKGINIALGKKIEDPDYILLLNNDTVVDKNVIKELLLEIEKDNSIGIVVPKIYFAKGYEFHKEKYAKEELGNVIWYAGGKMDWENVIGNHRGVDEVDRGQYDEIEETEIATGCCMLIKKTVLEKVGLFDERFFLYYEDADLSVRIKKAGYTIIYVPKGMVWHKNASSSGGSGSDLQDYYITRNRLLFGMKYASFRSKLALLKESWIVMAKGRSWQKRGVIDFYLMRFGKGSF